VTRGQLPQRAGSLGLNGGGTATAVPPVHCWFCRRKHHQICFGIWYIFAFFYPRWWTAANLDLM